MELACRASRARLAESERSKRLRVFDDSTSQLLAIAFNKPLAELSFFARCWKTLHSRFARQDFNMATQNYHHGHTCLHGHLDGLAWRASEGEALARGIAQNENPIDLAAAKVLAPRLFASFV